MYEDTLRKHLNEIIDNLGVEDRDLMKKYKNYKLEISDKHLKSRLGCYYPTTMKIKLTRYSLEKNANNVCVALHELAHHLDHCDRGCSAHDKEFYKEYRRLIYSALDLEKITKEEMAEMSKIASDYNKVMKILSEYKRKEPIINKSKELMYELNVQGVSEKDRRLISHGYTYNQRRKTWFKIISPKTVDYEKKVLNFLGISSYQLKDANKIQMLDDEQEFMNYQKDLAERKQLIIEKTEKEYVQLKRYLQRLIEQGFEFNELKQQLEGRDLPLENDTPAFRFRYVTLAGTLFNKKDKIELGDRFDIYEYRENDSQCVLQNVTIDGVKEAVEQIR